MRLPQTVRQMAAEDGISYDAMRARLARRGQRATRERDLSYRQAVARMAPEDAVEYLLAWLDDLTGDDLPPPVPGMTRQQSRIYRALEGRPRSHEYLTALIGFDGEPTSKNSLHTQISKMRHRGLLPPGERIVPIRGFGYRLLRG